MTLIKSQLFYFVEFLYMSYINDTIFACIFIVTD